MSYGHGLDDETPMLPFLLVRMRGNLPTVTYSGPGFRALAKYFTEHPEDHRGRQLRRVTLMLAADPNRSRMERWVTTVGFSHEEVFRFLDHNLSERGGELLNRLVRTYELRIGRRAKRPAPVQAAHPDVQQPATDDEFDAIDAALELDFDPDDEAELRASFGLEGQQTSAPYR